VIASLVTGAAAAIDIRLPFYLFAIVMTGLSAAAFIVAWPRLRERSASFEPAVAQPAGVSRFAIRSAEPPVEALPETGRGRSAETPAEVARVDPGRIRAARHDRAGKALVERLGDGREVAVRCGCGDVANMPRTVRRVVRRRNRSFVPAAGGTSVPSSRFI
jgi:hypothetical protein